MACTRERRSPQSRSLTTGFIRSGILPGLVAVLMAVAGSTPVLAGAPADTLRFRLDGAVRTALANSPEVAAVTSRRASAAARASLARASRYLTEFSASSTHAPAPGIENPNNTPTGRLFLDPDVRNDWGSLRPFNEVKVEFFQPLYTWGEISGNVSAATSATRAEDAAVREKELDVVLRTAELYYGLLLTEALQVVVKDAGDVVEQAKDEIDRLLQEGAPDVDDADLYQVLITEQEFKRRVVEVEERNRTAEVGLRRQLFLPEGVVVDIDEVVLSRIELPPASLEQYQDLAMRNRPEIDRARAGLEARKALIEVARSDYYPKVFLGGRFRAAATAGRYSQDNPYHGDRLRGTSFEAGVGVRLGLSFHQTHARVARATAQANELAFRLDGLRQLILFQVEEAYRSLITADAALSAAQEAYRLSKEWLQMETVNFDLELGDTENLVKAVRANLDLQARQYQAIYEYNLAALKLLRACGTIRDTIDSGMFIGE